MTLSDLEPDFKVMVLLLVFMQLTRDLFAIAKFLLALMEIILYMLWLKKLVPCYILLQQIWPELAQRIATLLVDSLAFEI